MQKLMLFIAVVCSLPISLVAQSGDPELDYIKNVTRKKKR
jgi:hypothetical protein